VAPGRENTETLLTWSNLANFAPIPVPGTLIGTMPKVANLTAARTLKAISAKSSIFIFS
jgi:hypothetical protein